ncbi:amino acid aminotransferase [Algicola sagamiensis]|uniref:amino acid aminotransferase n=1 Tax=Algicola sagamiensis TaxID=163869 RepID=UPI00037B89B1|nr:amino acid aminotransferase [Algicola sagamiensis]
MFSELKPLPLDPILSLMQAYKEDTHPNKIDLGVGVYKDEAGHTKVLDAVKKAEEHRLKTEDTKTYIGLAGDLGFNAKIEALLFGAQHQVIEQDRVVTAQAPGGTGALRVAAEFIKRCNPEATIWVCDPTWANHYALFEAAHLSIREYPYYDQAAKSLRFEEMMQALMQVKSGDVVLLHACCHNPTGMDLTKEQWQKVAELLKEKQAVPLIDTAYLGFGEGLEEDAYGIRLLADQLDEVIICSSCSKNFGLYRERTGGCTVVAKNTAHKDNARSLLLTVVRGIYSMPPAHGAAIVDIILGSDELTKMWHDELAEMRNRINGLRELMVSKISDRNVAQDFGFIQQQYGMFSFLGINKEQIARLRDDYSIYIVGSSRVNVAGVSRQNIDYFADALADVLK